MKNMWLASNEAHLSFSINAIEMQYSVTTSESENIEKPKWEEASDMWQYVLSWNEISQVTMIEVMISIIANMYHVSYVA